MLIPASVYAGLCAGLSSFARRNQALSFGAGVIVVAVVWGIGTSLLRVLPVSPLQSPVLAAFTYGALLEEGVKLLVLFALWRLARLRGGRDLLPVATGLACGFAAAENVLALWGAAHPAAALLQRALMTLPAHMAYAAIVAAILARIDPLWCARGVLAALVAAILVHGAYDTATLEGESGLALLIAALFAAFVAQAWWRSIRAEPAPKR